MVASASKSAVAALTLVSCSILANANAAAGIIKALNIYGGQLYPEFSPTNFDYELDLDDEGILQKHKDFGVLSNNLALSPAGGHNASVILAPHLSLDEYGEQQQEQPRLFVDGREVPRKPRQTEHPHVAISRKELLAASFRREDGRHAYSLIVLEVHLPRAGNTDLEEDGGLSTLRYIFRVHNAVNRIEEAKQRKLLATAPQGWGAPVAAAPEAAAIPEGVAEVMRGSDTIAMKLTDGVCVRTTGPFTTKPLVSESAQELGLYQGDSQHIVCFGDAVDKAADEEDRKFKFEAKRFGTSLPDSDLGKFGFGAGARVALRPEIATDAVWPLQEGVQSLGVPLQGSTFRAIGLRVHAEDGKQIDLPVVMTRTPEDWLVDVQFVNSSIGKCHPRPGPDNVLLFVCRADEDIPEETPTQFMVFCPDCREQGSDAKRRLTMNVDSEGGGAAGGRQTSATLQVASSQNAGGVEKPWASWTTEVPAQGLQRQWAITVRDVKGGSSLKAPEVFQVIFVAADTTLGFESVTLTSSEKEKLVAAGTLMSQAAIVIGTLLSAVSLATFVLGLPNRLLAVLPSLSATAMAMQFLAYAGNLPSAPEPLQALAGPVAWLAPGTAKSTLLTSIGVFFMVLVVHGLAVCKFIIYNGRGSANALPHGFSFGGWELRALGILAFPLVTSTATYVVPFLVPSQRYTFWFFASVPAAILLSLVAGLVVFTWKRVSKAIHDDEVLLMTLPAPVGSHKEDGYPVFTDHFCDQLRSIPSDAGQSTLLADWLATPSWCHKPEVASIHLVEHRGSRLFKPTMFHWCSEYNSGPWRAHQPRQQVEDEANNDPNVVKLPSDYTLFKLGIKQAPSATNAEAVYREVNAEFEAARGGNDRGSIATNATVLWGNATSSELVTQHPIGIKTKFAYQGSQMAGGTVAGVRCLSWINCAIPAATLVKLEGHLQGEVTLRTQVGQMSGPVSGGRFAACFDWGVLWPWNWPADVALKVMLGIWAAMLPFAGELSSTTASVLNGTTLGLAVSCAWATVVFRPYVHIFDVLAAACGRTAVALTVGACLMLDNSAKPTFSGAWGSFVPAMLVVAVLTLVPLCILLVATVILTMSMMKDTTFGGCSQGNKAAEELLEKFWQDRRQNDELYEHVDLGKHMIDVVFQDMHPAPRLPALVRSPVEHLRLQPSPGRRGSCTQLPPAGKPWLSLVPSLLFPLASNRTSNNNNNSRLNPSRSAAPIAALTEGPDDGRLLFQERANNGGLEWREVLHSFVDAIDEDCAEEAERLIQAYEFPLEGAGAERSLVIIELIPSDTSTGLMSLIR